MVVEGSYFLPFGFSLRGEACSFAIALDFEIVSLPDFT
jgi:hypothetical protein